MFFQRESREPISKEIGSTDTATLSKVIGERWGQLVDRSRFEQMAAHDKGRHEREMAAYDAALEQEHVAEEARLAMAAAGPSDREVERSEKRARLADEVESRAAAPKKEKKARVLTAAEKTLSSQNKEIEDDKARAAKQRLNFLLGQSDLFKHFGMVRCPQPHVPHRGSWISGAAICCCVHHSPAAGRRGRCRMARSTVRGPHPAPPRVSPRRSRRTTRRPRRATASARRRRRRTRS